MPPSSYRCRCVHRCRYCCLREWRVEVDRASENRNAVTTWVQGLRFRPATQDGIPVAGTYRQSFSVAVRTMITR